MNPLNLFRHEAAQAVGATEALFRKGDAGDTMFVVLEGTVDVWVDGKHIETIGPGSVVGELALIDDEPRSADAIARTPLKVAVVSRDRFAFLIQQTPFFALHVMRVLAERLRRTTSRLQ